MSGDGRIHNSQVLTCDSMVKLGHARDGSVVGVAGTAGSVQLILRWFADGEPTDELPMDRPSGAGEDTSFDALILRPDGRIERMDSDFAPFPQDCPAAIGAGALAALTAMHCGRSPEQAILLASRLVLTVGGKITTKRPKQRKPRG